MDFKEVASQLRKPDGEFGKQIALNMNKSNLYINQNMIDILPLENTQNILEIGMGNGFFVKDILAKNNVIHYTGCDFSETMIAESIEINKEYVQNKQVDFIQTETKKLPFADNSFEVVFTINTLYFWENPLIELSEIKRVLKPNGKLFIGIRSKKVMQTLPFTAYNFTLYEPAKVRDLFQKSEFRNIEIIEKEEPSQMMGEHAIKMDTVIVFGEK